MYLGALRDRDNEVPDQPIDPILTQDMCVSNSIFDVEPIACFDVHFYHARCLVTGTPGSKEEEV